MGTPDVQIPMTLMLIKEVTIKGSFRYGVSRAHSLTTSVFFFFTFCAQPGDYPLAISLVAQGRVDLKPLVTHRFVYLLVISTALPQSRQIRFPFHKAIEAFEATQAGKSDDGKPVIKAIISGPDVSPDDHL